MSEAESKAKTAVGLHGAMPKQLKDYWLHGAGAAKIRWGEGGDYDRCVVEVGEKVDAKYVHGICGNLHEAALGISTAEHTKLLAGGDSHSSTSAAHVLARRVR
jgi:hypothetical protein